MSSDHTQSIITVADVLRMIEEREQLVAQLRLLETQIEFVRRYMGEERFQEMIGEKAAAIAPVKRRPNILRTSILTALESRPEGATYEDLRSIMAEELQAYSPNTLLNTASAMHHRKEIEKIGKRLFLPEAFKNLPPEKIEELRAEDGHISAREAVLEILEGSERGLPAGQIKEAIQETYPKLRGTALYAALSRMVQLGKLNRDDEGRYKIA